MPVIYTASEPGGPNGPIMEELAAAAPGAIYVGRKGEVSAWDNADFVKAATGFSIGVSRLQAALNLIGRAPSPAVGPVIVTIKDRDRISDYQKMVQALREAGIRSELYLGNPKDLARQFDYADKRRAPVAVIQGAEERELQKVILKDMIEGSRIAAALQDTIISNREWKETRSAQVTVNETDLVAEVRKILARHA